MSNISVAGGVFQTLLFNSKSPIQVYAFLIVTPTPEDILSKNINLMVRVWLALFVWMIWWRAGIIPLFLGESYLGSSITMVQRGGWQRFKVLSKPTRIHFISSEPLLLRLSYYGRGRYNIILTLKDPRVACITFAIKERFRTLVDVNAIQFNVLTLKYYRTFGTLMIA